MGFLLPVKMKKIIVISLGGSLIFPDKININLLKKFKKIILANTNKYKFIVVCGGGSPARKYINALKEEKVNELYQSYIGISATRTNARFMNYFFNKDAERGIPHILESVERELKEHDVVFCGALEYKPNQTSDATSAEIANHFKTEFINLTLVAGLYDKNPLDHKNAKFIPKISWTDFEKMIKKIKFKPGQHFVLDQSAASIIKRHRIKTYILGKNLNNLDNFLKEKKFTGSVIEG